jgi:uncharacterized protein YndB with AHSA1/START domain
MDKVIEESTTLPVSADATYRLFTDNRLLENWLTVKADVEPKAGGKYELFWEPDDPGNNSTIGCKILAVQRPHFIHFEWKGPKQYKHFMNVSRPLTHVTVIFTPMDTRTRVTLIHSGWREGDDWEEARQYFIKAWSGAFKRLEESVRVGGLAVL